MKYISFGQDDVSVTQYISDELKKARNKALKLKEKIKKAGKSSKAIIYVLGAGLLLTAYTAFFKKK